MPLLRWQIIGTSAGSVALCQRPEGSSLLDVVEKIAVDPKFSEVDEVVIREPVDRQISGVPPMQAFQRARGIPVKLLGSRDYRHLITRNINSLASDGKISDAHIPEIRELELKFFARQHGAVLPRIPGGYYRTPSGRFVRRFLRAGQTQSSQAVLDAYFFWMLPKIKGKSAIATDTWSISSIALNACRRAAQYDITNLRLRFMILPHNAPTGKDPFVTLAEALQSDRTLIIMSVSHSGEAIKRIEDTFNSVPLKTGSVESLVLYDLGEVRDSRSLCSLHQEYREDFDQSRTPETGSPIVDIHKYTLFPSNFVDEKLGLNMAHTKDIKGFLDLFGNDNLSVHRRAESQTGPRHSAFFVDTVKLFKLDAFQDRFKETIKAALPEPKIIIFYPHDAGHILANFAREVFPNVLMWAYPTLDNLTADEQKALSGADAIMVIDDAFITGQRLSTYQMQLRGLKYSGVIHYRVGVARPSELEDWHQRKKKLSHNLVNLSVKTSTAAAVSEFALPHVDTDTCPWCVEYQMYDRYAQTIGPLPEPYRTRFDLLQGQQTPISPFLTGLDGEIGSGSIFCPDGTDANSATCAVSAALQTMRKVKAPVRLIPRQYPIARVVDSSTFLPGHFKDALLRAAILRGCSVEELALTNRSEEKKRGDDAIVALLEHKDTPHFNGFVRELCLAFYAGKLPYFIGERLRGHVPVREQAFWAVVHGWRRAD